MGSSYQGTEPFLSALHATAYFKYIFNIADIGVAAEGIQNLICGVSCGDRSICNVMN